MISKEFSLYKEIKERPQHFSLVGIGTRCLAVSHRAMVGEVCLLHYAQKGKRNNSNVVSSAGDRAFVRTIEFASKFDDLISTTLPRPFVHSTLLRHEIFPHPLSFKLASYERKVAAARVVKKIHGRPLLLPRSAQASVKLSNGNKKALAHDLAIWMHTLHSVIGPKALDLLSQEAIGRKRLCPQPTISGKFKYNLRRTHRILAQAKKDSEQSNRVEHENIVLALKDAGMDISALTAYSKRLKEYLAEKLAKQNEFSFVHGDLHFGNILVDAKRRCVKGVCDWMNKGTDCRAVDFMPLGRISGFLPLVLDRYSQLEKGTRNPIDRTIVHTYAAASLTTNLLISCQYGKRSLTEELVQGIREQVKNVASEDGRNFGEFPSALERSSFQISVPCKLNFAPSKG